MSAAANDFMMEEYFDTGLFRYTCYEREQLPDYIGTDVYHLVSLPENYSAGRKYPVIFELVGNRWKFGDGSVEEAHFGVSLSLKKDFIVVVVPYVEYGGRCNAPLWWGDEELTVSYLKDLVDHIDSKYGIDRENLFLCGFSRGAIGVSYIGLHDDKIAGLWKAFISHDHFDGFRAWPDTEWGFPLEKYRKEAEERLHRAKGRPWYVSYNGKYADSFKTIMFEMGVEKYADFRYAPVEMEKRFQDIPNCHFRSPHNDIWPAFDIEESREIRRWLYRTAGFPDSDERLWYKQPATTVSEALPVGNGEMGALIFGGVREERVVLNEESIWASEPEPKKLAPDFMDSRDSIMQCLFRNDMADAATRMKKLDRTIYTGDKPLIIGGTTQIEHCYETMGNASFYFDIPEEPVGAYCRSLDLKTAMASVRYEVGDNHYERTVFCSHPSDILVMRVSADSENGLSFRATFSGPEESCSPADVRSVSSDEISMTGSASENGVEFQVNMRILSYGGTVLSDGGVIVCRNVKDALVLVASATSFKSGNNLEAEIRKKMDAASDEGYYALADKHVKDYKSLYDMFGVRLDKTICSFLPTDVRLRRYRNSSPDPRWKVPDCDPALAALFCQYGRYILISTAREGTLPPILQEWTNSLKPTWYGRYTTNINLQENYWGVETTGLSALHNSLFDFVMPFVPAGRNVAELSYGCKGFVFPGRGLSVYGPEYIYDSWNDSAGWVAAHFWDHYMFTGDKDFLEKKAYPFLKGASEFYLDYLKPSPEGYLVTGPSHSPENSFIYGGRVSSIDYGVTMSNAIIRELFCNTTKACEILGKDDDFAVRLKNASNRLMPYRVGRYGIQEWRHDYDECHPGHRHVSHLYGVYPGCEITEADTLLSAAARRSFMRRLGNGGFWTAWSASHGIGLAARLGLSEEYFMLVHRIIADYTFDNLFTCHMREHSYDVVSIDGNTGYAGAFTEALLQSHDGRIRILPALPQAWKNGCVYGVCARGGFRISIEWENGKMKRTEITSLCGNMCRVEYGGKTLEFPTEKGVTYILCDDMTIHCN